MINLLVMNMNYKHLTKEDHVQIQTLNDAGHSSGYIAKTIGCSSGTISRELSRGSDPTVGKYRYSYSNNQSVGKRDKANKLRSKLVELNPELLEYLESKLKESWSPEQIVGRIKLDKLSFGSNQITLKSHQTIYDYIHSNRPELVKYLRCKKGNYRRRYGTRIREKEREAMNKKRIDQRPEVITNRERIGDWEGDTIVGKDKTHMLTHVDRMSGYLQADILPEATAVQTQTTTIKRFKQLPENKLATITYDNGVQFAKHQDTEQKLNIDIYFANPYHSWERGTNENTNGLLREYYPKGSNFAGIVQKDLDNIVKTINNRPRKRHNYNTPQEIWDNSSLKL